MEHKSPIILLLKHRPHKLELKTDLDIAGRRKSNVDNSCFPYEISANRLDRPLVLVVDDHETQRELFRLLADHLPFDFHAVASGADAIESIHTFQFAAILMDISMPGMDGYECTKKIREMEAPFGRHTPIIAVTARVMPKDREECIAAGLDDFLAKPFTLIQLREKLRKWASYPAEEKS
jgi:CheY-like chemotaxis protein